MKDLSTAELPYKAAGFVTLAKITDSEGVLTLVHLRREKYQDILMTQGSPGRGTVSASFAAGVVDLAEVADRIRSSGAEVTEPTDTDWFTTDVTFANAAGNRVILTAPRLVELPAARAWANDQISGDFKAAEGISLDPRSRQ